MKTKIHQAVIDNLIDKLSSVKPEDVISLKLNSSDVPNQADSDTIELRLTDGSIFKFFSSKDIDRLFNTIQDNKVCDLQNTPIYQAVNTFGSEYLSDLVHRNVISQNVGKIIYENFKQYIVVIVDELSSEYHFSVPIDVVKKAVAKNITALIESSGIEPTIKSLFRGFCDYQSQSEPDDTSVDSVKNSSQPLTEIITAFLRLGVNKALQMDKIKQADVGKLTSALEKSIPEMIEKLIASNKSIVPFGVISDMISEYINKIIINPMFNLSQASVGVDADRDLNQRIINAIDVYITKLKSTLPLHTESAMMLYKDRVVVHLPKIREQLRSVYRDTITDEGVSVIVSEYVRLIKSIQSLSSIGGEPSITLTEIQQIRIVVRDEAIKNLVIAGVSDEGILVEIRTTTAVIIMIRKRVKASR